jgi:hypothetical protein
MNKVWNKPRKVLELSPEDGRRIVGGWNKEFEIISKDIYDTGRWSLKYIIIVKRLSDGKFFKSLYQVGATELQYEEAYEYVHKAVFTEVFPVEKTVTAYE